MANTDLEKPVITLPCKDYPIKIVGDSSEDFVENMISIVVRHAPDLDRKTVTQHDSRNGRFMSVRLRITAQSVEQLQALHQDLKDTGHVHMVL